MKKISLLLSLFILVSCSKEMNQELTSDELTIYNQDKTPF